MDDLLIIGDAAAVSTSTMCTRTVLETPNRCKKTLGGIRFYGASNKEKPPFRSDLHRLLNAANMSLVATFPGPDVAVQVPDWTLPSPVEGACLRCLVSNVP